MPRWRLSPPLGAEGYQETRDNNSWVDHRYRALLTAASIDFVSPESLADPACGDASIEMAAQSLGTRAIYLNDISKKQVMEVRLSPWYMSRVRTPRLTNLDAYEFVEQIPDVDCIVLTEILEHLEDPDLLVRMSAAKAKNLIASSPIGEEGTNNHEHTWGWDEDGYHDMLVQNGWKVQTVVKQYMNHMKLPYNFQIWTATSTNT